MMEGKTVDLSEEFSSNQYNQFNTTKELHTESTPCLSYANSSALHASSIIRASQKLRQTQKLRLSAEGLLDIVTQQAVEGKMTPSMLVRKRPVAPTQQDDLTRIHESPPAKLAGAISVKEATLLTPILTEPSQGANSSLKKNPDNREMLNDASPSTKL